MTPQELKDFSEALACAIKDTAVSCDFCGNEERRMVHRKDHEFVQKISKAWDRFCDFNWEILATIVKWGTIAFLGMLLSVGAYAIKHAIDQEVTTTIEQSHE